MTFISLQQGLSFGIMAGLVIFFYGKIFLRPAAKYAKAIMYFGICTAVVCSAGFLASTGSKAPESTENKQVIDLNQDALLEKYGANIISDLPEILHAGDTIEVEQAGINYQVTVSHNEKLGTILYTLIGVELEQPAG